MLQGRRSIPATNVWRNCFLPKNQGLRGPPTNPRPFSHNSQLLLVSHGRTRPQLPFLHSAIVGRASQNSFGNQLPSQLARLLTTERKVFLKQQVILGIKYSIILWTIVGLLYVISFGIQIEIIDRAHPCPPEWSFKTKQEWRRVKKWEEPNEQNSLVDWAVVGGLYRLLLKRLEDPAVDGAGIQPTLKSEGDIYVKGVGKAGLDISAKSEPWQRAYHKCLMGMAMAAENRDGWVQDKTTNVCFPKDQVIGPSNPHPKQVPPGSPPAPFEDNCILVFDPPETYYMKILTTQGFHSRQRLEAALACANWFDYKGLPSTAEDMYDWALDIAMGALPQGVNNAVDIKTGIINSDADYVSTNLLHATTALASHHAQYGNLSAALPIYLSVLRAQRENSVSPSPGLSPEDRKDPLTAVTDFIKSAFSPRPYPPPPPTGGERPRRTATRTCEEAGIMANIGEILFASSMSTSVSKSSPDSPTGKPIPTKSSTGHLQNQQMGLGWTREAVDLAEATLESVAKDDEEARTKCAECLAMGIENWSSMVDIMLKDEREAKASTSKRANSKWFWGGDVKTQLDRWEEEEKAVNERFKRTRRMLLREEQRRQERSFLATLFGAKTRYD